MTSFFASPAGLLRGRRRAAAGHVRREDRGASAVEFALISPLLFTLLFAAIDYGLYFADAMSLQQTVTDGARQATLTATSGGLAWPDAAGCVPGSAYTGDGEQDLGRIVCSIASAVSTPGGGTVQLKADLVDPDGNPVQNWQLGNQLRVCAVERHDAVLPFVPLPDGGLVRTRVIMPIQGGPASLLLSAVAPDVSSLGTSWSSWC